MILFELMIKNLIADVSIYFIDKNRLQSLIKVIMYF